MNTFKAVCLCLALNVCFAIQLKTFTDCGGHGLISSVVVEPCDSEPCHLKQGQTYSTSINFTAQEHSKTLTNICHGIISGTPTPFQITPSDACVSGVSCPLIPGQSRVYSASVTCPSDAPLIRLAVKWEVRDDTDRDLICIVFPVELTNGTVV